MTLRVELRGLDRDGNQVVKGTITVGKRGIAVGDTRYAQNWVKNVRTGAVVDGEQKVWDRTDGEEYLRHLPASTANTTSVKAVVIE